MLTRPEDMLKEPYVLEFLGLDEKSAYSESDLEQAHSDIRNYVTRIDVMRWGHAMIQPRPGFIWSPSRRRAASVEGAIHFAATDLSGVALMEEAYYHGIRAAEEVLAARNISYSSFL